MEPQLTPRSETPLFKRTWERFHDRLEKRRSLLDPKVDEEEATQELARYVAPWVDMIGLHALNPIEDEELNEKYAEYDPDLKETWEDDYYRKAIMGDLDLDNPGGDWGENRMTFGIAPPAKIYYRAMIDAYEMEDVDRVLQLFDAIRTDLEISIHEIPSGVYRLAMDCYSRESPGDAHKCFLKIVETNDQQAEDYQIIIESYLFAAENGRALDAYSALTTGHLKKKVSVESHQLGFIAATLAGDAYVVEKSRNALLGMKDGGQSAVPQEAEIAAYATLQALQLNDIDGVYKQFQRVKDTYTSVPQDRKNDALSDAGTVMMRVLNQRQEYPALLETYRLMASELGDQWIYSSAPLAEMVIRGYLNSGDADEAKRILQNFIEAKPDEERDPVVLDLLNPFVEVAVRKDSQKELDDVFNLARELGLAEDPADFGPLYLAAMRAKPDDPEHLSKFFESYNFEQNEADIPVSLVLNCFIKEQMWTEAAVAWKKAINSATFRTMEPYVAGLQVAAHFKNLDAIMTIARAIAANGTPITYGFSRDLANALANALPAGDEIQGKITHELLNRLRRPQATPNLMMSRVHQAGALHVLEKVRAGVQELFVD
jgi:tetratricopeptide (TPR) repeat protein